MGDQDTAAAATRRLRFLQDENTGRRTPRRSAGPAPRGSFSAPPLNVAFVDHVARSVDEVITHTRAANPDAGPAPQDPTQVYHWMRHHTEHLDDGREQAREAMVYRQGLEHALQAGDDTVIRPIPCPNCACYSLHWRAPEQRAVCFYGRCTPNGIPRRYTLQQLSYRAVEKSSRRLAT